MANVHSFAESNRVEVLIANAAQGSLNTAWVSPFARTTDVKSDRAVFFLLIGAATDNVDMKLTQATDSTGTGAKDITGAAITTITTTTDEVIVSIEIGPSALDDKNGFKWVRGEVTVASGTPPYSVFLQEHRVRRPGEITQGATYAEQVLVLG